jgi:hypothetical protein
VPPTATATPTNTPGGTPSPTATPAPPTLLVGDQTIEANNDNNPAGSAELFQYTAVTTGSVNQLWIFLNSNNTANKVSLAMYSDSNNNPQTLLAQGTITSPAAGLWNSVAVTPVTVTAGSKYWLGVLSPVGSGTVQFRDTFSGTKAVGSSSSTLNAFPTTWSAGGTWNNAPASIYAVRNSAISTTPPVISGISAINVTDSSATITWTTDEPSTSIVNYGTTTSYGSTSTSATLVINHSQTLNGLNANTTYHYQVQSVDNANNVATSSDFTFTTPALTPPSSPILLVVDPSSPNPFGNFLGEILRTEGINSYQKEAPANLTAAYLAGFPTVILTQTSPLTSQQATMYTNYVSGGGSLIAMRPDSQLASVFGITRASGTTSEGYLLVNASNPISSGISNQTLQYHGAADNYNVTGGTSLATLYSGVSTATSFPAVVTNTFGSGRAAAFTFDLAQSVAYMRQGNPATQGQPYTDGIVRTEEGFVNGWVNLDRVAVPQADEEQRLLANIITTFGQQSAPVPRLWYFPSSNTTSMLLVTADDHGQQNSVYQSEINSISPAGGKMTFYLSRFGALTNAALQSWKSQGYEFTIHPYAQADNQTLDQGFAAAINWFQSTYGLAPTQTVRNHQLAWQGWADAAKVEQKYGVAMDTSFYTWGSWLQKTNGQWICDGWITGSGLPMQFVDQSGNLIPVYEQMTELVDEHMLTGTDFGYCGMNQTQATTASQQLIDQSQAGFYSALVMQVHTDYQQFTWLANTANYAQSKGVPMWTMQHWLNFVQARHNSTIDQFNWNSTAHTLTFRYTSSTTEPSTPVMVPSTWNSRSITSTTIDGASVTAAAMSVKGLNYAAVAVPSGAHAVTVQYAP